MSVPPPDSSSSSSGEQRGFFSRIGRRMGQLSSRVRHPFRSSSPPVEVPSPASTTSSPPRASQHTLSERHVSNLNSEIAEALNNIPNQTIEIEGDSQITGAQLRALATRIGNLTSIPFRDLSPINSIDLSNSPPLFVGNIPSGSLQVCHEKIKENPLKLILDLSKYDYMPRINYVNDKGEHMSGMDAGGLSRDLITHLFDTLLNPPPDQVKLPFKFEKKPPDQKPTLKVVEGAKPEEVKEALEALGTILTFCSNGSLVIGEIFDLSVFAAIKEIASLPAPATEDEKKLAIYHSLNCDDPSFKEMLGYTNCDSKDLSDSDLEKVLYYAYPEFDWPQDWGGSPTTKTIKSNFEMIQKKLKHELLDQAKESKEVEALYHLANGMSSIYPKAKTSSALELQTLIQGELSPQKFIDSIVCTNSTIKEHLVKVINSNSDQENRVLLRAITGSTTLPKNKKVRITERPKSDQPHENYPHFHTCGLWMDIPAFDNFNDFQDILKNGVRMALEGTAFTTE